MKAESRSAYRMFLGGASEVLWGPVQPAKARNVEPRKGPYGGVRLDSLFL